MFGWSKGPGLRDSRKKTSLWSGWSEEVGRLFCQQGKWRHVLPQCKGPFCTTATLPFWLCVFNPIKGMFRAHVERTFAYKSKCTLIAKFSGRTNAFREFTILPSRVALAQRFAYENSFFFHESLGPMANLAGPPQKIPLFNVDAGVAIRSVSKRVRPGVTSQLVENTLHFSQSMNARNIKKHQETSRNIKKHQETVNFIKCNCWGLIFDILPTPTDPDKKINIFACSTQASRWLEWSFF